MGQAQSIQTKLHWYVLAEVNTNRCLLRVALQFVSVQVLIHVFLPYLVPFRTGVVA